MVIIRRPIEGVGIPTDRDFSKRSDAGLTPGPGIGIPTDAISGIKKKRYRVVTFDMDTIGTDIQVNIAGTLVWLVDSRNTSTGVPNANNRILIRFHDSDGDQVPIYAGYAIAGIPFDKLFLTWPVTADNEFSLLILTDEPAERIDVET